MTVVELEHGTRVGYRRCQAGEDGGACRECRQANAAATAESRRSPRSYIAAGKVRTHLVELHESGLSVRAIAREAGLGRGTVGDLLSGAATRCSVDTKRRLLGIAPRPPSYISVVRDEEPDESDLESTAPDPLAAFVLRLVDPQELAWKRDADCRRLGIPVQRRLEWFFPERGESAAPALGICAQCPVWQPCLQFALDHNHDGIAGRSAGSHRRKLVHHKITVAELADAGMADDPELTIAVAIERVLDAREAVA